MPLDSTTTKKAILESAQQEFLQKGFAGAHLRTIAANAHVTTGALYRHYKNKEALFIALVQPICEDVYQKHQNQTAQYIALLETDGMDPIWNWNNSGPNKLVQYIYSHLDEFKLLITVHEIPVFEEFLHTLVELEVTSTLRYLEQAKQHGFTVNIPDAEVLHIISNAQFLSFFELIQHDIPKEKALSHIKIMTRYFTAGWKETLLK